MTRRSHFFGSDGTYGTGGTWTWEDEANNVMRVKDATGRSFTFNFIYTTANEMSFALGSDAALVYRDAPW